MENKKKKLISWKGFRDEHGLAFEGLISEKRFKILWEKLKKWKGSHKNFYFRFVNPHRFKEVKEKPRGKTKCPKCNKRIIIKTNINKEEFGYCPYCDYNIELK